MLLRSITKHFIMTTGMPTAHQVVCLLIAFLGNGVVFGHDLGEHGLTDGPDPTGAPQLPGINGAFEVEIKVRFNTMRDGVYENLFEYRMPDGQELVWFGATHENLWFQIRESYCNLRTPSNVGKLYKLKFGIDTDTIGYLYVDGVLAERCYMYMPGNVTRDRYIGSGPRDSSSNIRRLRGAVLGARISSVTPASLISDDLKFQNLPGQPFGDSFVATFYARFGNVNGDRYDQRVFDFGNGEGIDNIWCGQVSNTADMACEVYQDSQGYRVTASGSIEDGKYAFWHFGVDSDGTLWLEKDGSRLNAVQHSFALNNVFRQSLLFGESNWAAHDDLEGAVLGFRLDRRRGARVTGNNISSIGLM